jgi:hydroxymethylbilane synthase
VFFSSKNAVEYFFQLSPNFPKKVKFGVMGTGSEDMLRKNGILPILWAKVPIPPM